MWQQPAPLPSRRAARGGGADPGGSGAAGAGRPRCPRCRARIQPGELCCGLCHYVFPSDPFPDTPPDTLPDGLAAPNDLPQAPNDLPQAPNDLPQAPSGQPQARRDDPQEAGPDRPPLVGGELPDRLVAELMAELRAGSDPALPASLGRRISGWGQAGVAAGGAGLVIAVLLLIGLLAGRLPGL